MSMYTLLCDNCEGRCRQQSGCHVTVLSDMVLTADLCTSWGVGKQAGEEKKMGLLAGTTACTGKCSQHHD